MVIPAVEILAELDQVNGGRSVQSRIGRSELEPDLFSSEDRLNGALHAYPIVIHHQEQPTTALHDALRDRRHHRGDLSRPGCPKDGAPREREPRR